MNNEYRTMGLMIAPSNLECEEPKTVIQRPEIKKNGKEVCTYLRNMRKELAAVNGIVFFQQPCNNIGPCAGTCEVCDQEIDYINKELNKIPSEKRIYPDMYMRHGNGEF